MLDNFQHFFQGYLTSETNKFNQRHKLDFCTN